MDTDLLVIGGGINGVGVAADAAGRGLRVTLCEMGDLANATSSASSKLIHGGLRYLENYEFGLVRESLCERRILRTLAPHLIHVQPFVLPHCPGMRPNWLIRAGLFLYDHLADDPGMPASTTLKANEVATLGLQDQFKKAFRYYDCTEDDSRLVVSVALLAQQHGAEILTRTKIIGAKREASVWRITLEQTAPNKSVNLIELNAKVIVNAAGPWVQHVAQDILHVHPHYNMKLVKGSHIIVPRLFKHDQAFLLQSSDERVVFLIPYLNDFTLIGTTEMVLDHIEYPTQITAQEIQYLCDITNQFVQRNISPQEIVHTYAGIRPLFDDNSKRPSKITRDYVIDIDEAAAPVLSIFGGKITTYRRLAENLGDQLRKYFPHCGPAWTATAYLPGGKFENCDVAAFTEELIAKHPALPVQVLRHYVNNYGTRALEIVGALYNAEELGQHFGAQLYQCEVDYLMQHEWARSAEDILWRRGKMGMWSDAGQVVELEKYIYNHNLN